jgi:quinol monooxygenase YgiN
MIRVVYELDVAPGRAEDLKASWRAIVDAHAGGGALGSALFRDPEVGGRWVAMSTWVSREAWEANRRDDAAPEAYALFREVVEVASKRVLEEVERRGGAGPEGH